MSKDYGNVPSDKLQQYSKLITAHPDLELKGGQKLPYTSHNGNMFTFLTKAGKVGIRLGKYDREAFIEKYNTKLAENYGTVMKEYVEVPDDMLDDYDALKPYLDKSLAYAQTLKPKKSKK